MMRQAQDPKDNELNMVSNSSEQLTMVTIRTPNPYSARNSHVSTALLCKIKCGVGISDLLGYQVCPIVFGENIALADSGCQEERGMTSSSISIPQSVGGACTVPQSHEEGWTREFSATKNSHSVTIFSTGNSICQASKLFHQSIQPTPS